MHHEQGCDKLFVRIDRTALERQRSAHLGRTLREPISFAPCMPLDAGRSGPWLRVLDWVLTEMNAAPGSSCIDSPLLAAQIEQTVMAALLSVQPHQCNLGAVGAQAVHHRLTNQGRAPGDDRHLSIKTVHRRTPFTSIDVTGMVGRCASVL